MPPPTTVFHSSLTQPKPFSSAATRTPSPQQSPMAAGAPSEVTEAAFSRWKVELQNKLIVEQEKTLQDERLKYKAHEDNKFWERKQALLRPWQFFRQQSWLASSSSFFP